MRGTTLAAAALVTLAACEPASEQVAMATTASVAGSQRTAPATPEADVVERGFRDCAAMLPDLGAYRASLDRDGVRLQFAAGETFIHTTGGYRALLTSGTRGGRTYCGFGIKGMGGEEAERFADGLVRRTFGAGAGAGAARGVADDGETVGWVGVAGDRTMAVAVSRDISISPYFRGALIVMTPAPDDE